MHTYCSVKLKNAVFVRCYYYCWYPFQIVPPPPPSLTFFWINVSPMFFNQFVKRTSPVLLWGNRSRKKAFRGCCWLAVMPRGGRSALSFCLFLVCYPSCKFHPPRQPPTLALTLSQQGRYICCSHCRYKCSVNSAQWSGTNAAAFEGLEYRE